MATYLTKALMGYHFIFSVILSLPFLRLSLSDWNINKFIRVIDMIRLKLLFYFFYFGEQSIN